MNVLLIQETENPIRKIADIASICYGKSEARNPRKMVENLLKLEHLSVFEHIYFTWKIEDISRACLAQLTRHRHTSFTVRSQRYCDESKQLAIVPEKINIGDAQEYIYEQAIKISTDYYKQLLSLGVSREDARFILPQATTTDLYMSCNLRELLHIYKLRSHRSAQWEIRELVEKLRKSVNPEIDFMFDMVVSSQ